MVRLLLSLKQILNVILEAVISIQDQNQKILDNQSRLEVKIDSILSSVTVDPNSFQVTEEKQ